MLCGEVCNSWFVCCFTCLLCCLQHVAAALGIIIVLTITYCYMNLALRKDLCQLLDWKPPSEPPAQEKAHLLEEGEKTDGEGGDK